MKTKMAAIFLTLTIALGMFGFAAAWWTDELKIEGYVTTGTFGWEWTLDDWWVTDDDKEIIDLDVGLEDTDDNGYDDLFYIEAYDVYPCTDIEIWADLHFWGSVPGIISDVTAEGTITVDGVEEELTGVPEWMDIYFDVYDSTVENIPIDEYTVDELCAVLIDSQWHHCEYIDVYIYIHWVEYGMTYYDGTPVPEGVDVPMDETLEFTITIEGVQYNYEA